jgi:hypothetical protein
LHTQSPCKMTSMLISAFAICRPIDRTLIGRTRE